MSHIVFRSLRGYRALLLLCLVWLMQAPVAAADLSEQIGSLKVVPQSAAFYVVRLRMAETVQTIADSNAAERIKQLPAVQKALADLKEKLDDPQLAVPRALLAMPENQRLLAMLQDMVSDEIFVYGSGDYATVFETLADINSVTRQQMLENDGEPSPEVIKKIAEQLKDSKLPDTVIGFGLKDDDRAAEQLQRLEIIVTALLAEKPELKECLTKETIGGGEYMVFTIKGEMLPWEEMLNEIDEPDMAEAAGELVEVLKEKTFTVALGVYDGKYLILSFGDTAEHLADLGQGDVLAGHPNLEPAAAFADQPMLALDFVSSDFVQVANEMNVRNLEDLKTMLPKIFEQARAEGEVSENVLDEMQADAAKIIDAIKDVLPTPGSQLQFAFRTERGIEGYSYDWTQMECLPEPKNLTLLKHVGQDPLLFIVGAHEFTIEDYETLTKVVDRAYYYADTIVREKASPDDLAAYETFCEKMAPVVKQLDQANRDMMVPALQNGQLAVVLDAQIADKEWDPEMPEASEPLPLPILSLVAEVQDRDLLVAGYEQYVDVANKIAAILHEMDPDKVPEWTVPQLKGREIPEGNVYIFPIPEDCPLPRKLTPAIGLSDSVVALTINPRHAGGFLAETPSDKIGALADPETPLLAAAYINTAGIVEKATPWIKYAIDQEVDDDKKAEATLYAEAVLDVLKCVRGISSVSYKEDDVIVGHFEIEIRDLP